MPRGNWRWVVGLVVICGLARSAPVGAAPPGPMVAPGPLAPDFPVGAASPPTALSPLGSGPAGGGTSSPTPAPPQGGLVGSTNPPTTLPPLGSGPVVTTPGAFPVTGASPGSTGTTSSGGLLDLTPPGFATDPVHPLTDDVHEVPGHLNPSAPSTGGVFTSAEFLLDRARRGAFDFVLLSTNPGLATVGPVDSLNYSLQPGVKVDLGYRFGSTGWDVTGSYTYYHTSANQVVGAGPGEVLFPTLTRPGLVDQVSSAAATANLSYNMYDMTMGRRFAVDDHFALRMYGGLRFASIQQTFKAYYDGIDASQSAVSAGSTFQGFGPIIGTEGVLSGWRGLNVYARVAGGLVTGQSNNPLGESNNAGQTIYVNTSYNVREVVPTVSIGVGGGWQYRTMSVRVGYEITNWFGLMNRPRFSSDVAQGALTPQSANLSLEGLFVQVGVAF